MKPTLLKETLKFLIKTRTPAILIGPPGTGKSEMKEQAAEEVDYRYLCDYPATADPTDYKGLPFMVPGIDQTPPHARFLPFGNLLYLCQTRENVVMDFDEIGQAPLANQAALMHLVQARTVDGMKISDTVTFLFATNSHADNAGVKGLIEPLKNRCVLLKVEPDLDDWVSWALDQVLINQKWQPRKNLKPDMEEIGFPVEVIAHARFRPEYISMTGWKPSKDFVNSTTPRSIATVAKHLVNDIPKEIEYETFAGTAGEAYAADLLGFLKIFRSLPSIDLILMNPDKEKVPTDPATLYAVCAALAGKASSQTFPNIIKYANRMTPEFSVMLVRDIISKTRTLVNTKAFIEWSTKHSNVLI